MESAAAQAGLKTIVTSRAFLEKGKLEPPATVELIYLEDVKAGSRPQAEGARCSRWRSGPDPRARTLGRRRETADRSTTRPRSSSAAAAPASPRASCCRTSISIPTSRRSPRFIASCQRSPDRDPAVLSFVRLHDVLVRGQTGHGHGLSPQPARRRGDRRPGRAIPR